MNKTTFAAYAVAGVLVITSFFSCKKDIANEAQLSSQTIPRSILATNAVDFERPAFGTYDETQYITDFGNNSSGAWNSTRAGIATIDNSKTLYIKLLKDKLSSDGGVL